MNTLYFNEINFINSSGTTVPSTAKWYTYDEMFVCKTTNQYNTSCFYKEVSGYSYTKVYARNLKKIGSNSAYTTYFNGYRIFVNLKEVTGSDLNKYNNLFYIQEELNSTSKTSSSNAKVTTTGSTYLNSGGTTKKTNVYLPPVANNGGNNYNYRKIGLNYQFQNKTNGLRTKEWLYPKKKKVFHKVWVSAIANGNLVTIRVIHTGNLSNVTYYFGDGSTQQYGKWVAQHFYLYKGNYQISVRVEFDDGTIMWGTTTVKIEESLDIKKSKKIADLNINYIDSIVTDNSIIFFEGVTEEGESEEDYYNYTDIVIFSLNTNTITSIIDTSDYAEDSDRIIGVTNSFVYMCNTNYDEVFRIPFDSSGLDDWYLDLPANTTEVVVDWDKIIFVNNTEIISIHNLPEILLYQKSIYTIRFDKVGLHDTNGTYICFTNKQHISILWKDSFTLSVRVYNNGNVYEINCDTDYIPPD